MDKSKFLWWGYVHINGHIQVKRFFDGLDVQDAYESPFCERVFQPFLAENREDAIEIIKKQTEKKE